MNSFKTSIFSNATKSCQFLHNSKYLSICHSNELMFDTILLSGGPLFVAIDSNLALKVQNH